MRSFIAAIVLAVVMCGASAQAQTPCANPCTLLPNTSFTLQADHDGINTTGYRLYIDGTKVGADLPMTSLVSGAVSVPVVAPVGQGSHTLQVGAFGAGGEAKSVILTFTVKTPLPITPGNLRIMIIATVAENGTISFKVTSIEEIIPQ